MIIDAEVHLLHPEACHPGFAMASDEPVRKAIHAHPDFSMLGDLMSVEALIQSMDQHHIKWSFIMGLAWRDAGIQRENNQFILACVNKYHERLRGFYILDFANPTNAIKQINHIDGRKIIGAKIIPGWQGCKIDDPALQPVFNELKDRNLPLMVHTDHLHQSPDGDTPQRFFQMIKNNPGLKIFAPHMGGGIFLYSLLESVRKIMQNTIFITSVSSTMQMVEMAAKVIPEQIAFGTDYPFNHCHAQGKLIKEIEAMNIPHAVKKNILAETVLRTFQLSN